MKYNGSYEYGRDNVKSPSCWMSPNNSCLPHFHSSLEFVYVKNGQISAILDSHYFIASAGDFIIVPSYTIHSYVTKNFSDTYVFTIPLDTIPSYHSVLEKKTFTSLLLKSSSMNHEIIHCLEALLYYTADDKLLPSSGIIKGYTYVFLGLLIDKIGLSEATEQKLTSLVQNILVYIQEHFREPLSLEQLASVFGYSKSRFSHIFNQYFGCSMSDYINGLRSRYALELIQENNQTITDIALASGFESLRTFYRAFHKQFGYTPIQAQFQNKKESVTKK